MRNDVPIAARPTQQPLRQQGEWLLTFPAMPIVSLNDRDHWAVKGAKVRAWRDAALVLCRAAKIPACTRILVEMHYVPKQSRRRDEDNVVATLKPICDGIVDAKIVLDDTSEYVERVFPIIHKPGPNPGVYVRIVAL